MGWLGFSLMALGLWGVWGFLSKAATQQLPPPAVYFLAVCGHGAVIGYLWLGGELAFPWHPGAMAAALGAGLCMAVGLLCFFRALSVGAATVVVPLTALYPLVTVLLCWVVLREEMSPRHLAGIVLAMLAVWLLSK